MNQLQRAIMKAMLDTEAGAELAVEDVVELVTAVERAVIAKAATMSARSLERLQADSQPPRELVYLPEDPFV